MSACRQCVSFIAVLSTALSGDVRADAGLLCNAPVLVWIVRERRLSVGHANEPGHLIFCLRDVVQLYLHLSHSLPPGNTLSISIGVVINGIGCEVSTGSSWLKSSRRNLR